MCAASKCPGLMRSAEVSAVSASAVCAPSLFRSSTSASIPKVVTELLSSASARTAVSAPPSAPPGTLPRG